MLSDLVLFLAYPNLFEIKSFIVVDEILFLSELCTVVYDICQNAKLLTIC
jgi:hypothetical protein